MSVDGAFAPEARQVTWPRSSRSGAFHLMLTAGVVGLVALIPLLANRRFYFQDDTQSSAVGAWYEIGRQLVELQVVPFLMPGRFMGGNLPAEGQWATFNPLVLALGVLTYVSGNLLVMATFAKVSALVCLGMGTYLAARSYGVRPMWAAAAGMAAPFGGFTLYFDSASWVTGLWVFAGLPWAWWAMRRFSARRTSPVVPFVIGYLIISVGYVHGTLMLAVLIAGLILEALLARARRDAWRLLGIGVLQGMVAVFIYLPGILTAPVTWRSSQGVANDNFLSPDPSALVASFMATYRGWVASFSGVGAISAPVTYVSWLPLLLVFVDWRGAGQRLRSVSAAVVLAVVAFMLTFGPSAIGPLRFPIRLLPYVGISMIVMTAVLISAKGLVVSRSRLVALAAITGTGFYLAFAEYPQGLRGHLVAVGLAVLFLVGLVRIERWRPSLVPAATGVCVALTLGLQMIVAPHTPLPDFGLPAKAAAYQGLVPTEAGAVYVAGSPKGVKDPWSFTTMGNGWSVGGYDSLNVYSPIGFAALGNELCIETHGTACADGASRLNTVDQTTGRTVGDLLGVGILQIVGDGANAAALPGWRLESKSAGGTTWRRESPIATVGGVAWQQPGVDLADLQVDDRSVTFTVRAVPSSGGRVVLSRLAWPGYTATGGSIGAPLRGYLLTVDVKPEDVGKAVTVSFNPPGWNASVATLFASFAGVVGWTLAWAVRGRRRKKIPQDRG